MSPREKELTYHLIMRLGHKSTAHLMLHQGELRGIGQKIDHVPPLQFFSFIVTHAELKPALKLLLNRYLTRSQFINGAKQKLINQKKSGLLDQQLEGFSNYIQKDYKILNTFSDQYNWTTFIEYIAE